MNYNNNKFVYFSYLHGFSRNNYETILVNKETDHLLKSKENFTKYEEIYAMNVKGFIYKGEKDIKDGKEIALCFYKENGRLVCQILKITHALADKFYIHELFTFEVSDNYEVKNTYLILFDYFYIKNKLTGKIDFEFYYLHPYNRTLFYDGMFEDMHFKEFSKDFDDPNWRSELLNVLHDK